MSQEITVIEEQHAEQSKAASSTDPMMRLELVIKREGIIQGVPIVLMYDDGIESYPFSGRYIGLKADDTFRGIMLEVRKPGGVRKIVYICLEWVVIDTVRKIV